MEDSSTTPNPPEGSKSESNSEVKPSGKTRGRPKSESSRSAKNLYLDADLVARGEEIAKNSKHKSLSGLVESLLRREFDRIERNKNSK